MALKARVNKTEKYNEDTVCLNCEMIEPHELGFKGGQYIIINSGKILPNGKMGKRAYSITTPDAQQRQFDLVVKKVPHGVGSNFVHDLKSGDTFEFSGPWGKYQIVEETPGPILCIATDTGITAALGLLRGQSAGPLLKESKLIWFLSSPNYFIPQDQVLSWLPSGLSFHMVSPSPAIDDPSRSSFIEGGTAEILQEKVFTKIYLSGDGLVVRHLKSQFIGSGKYQPEQIIMESFFHHESLKTAAV